MRPVSLTVTLRVHHCVTTKLISEPLLVFFRIAAWSSGERVVMVSLLHHLPLAVLNWLYSTQSWVNTPNWVLTQFRLAPIITFSSVSTNAAFIKSYQCFHLKALGHIKVINQILEGQIKNKPHFWYVLLSIYIISLIITIYIISSVCLYFETL